MSRFLSPEWRDKLIAAGFPKDELCTGEAEEILRRLPAFLGTSHAEYRLQLWKALKCWVIEYINTKTNKRKFDANFGDQSLANAAAAMYVYLSEHQILPTP